MLAPEVLLLDEPIASLDAQSRHIVESVLRDLRQQRQRTVLFTTHDHSQAYRLADEVIALHQGQLLTQP
ncbi:MAG: ABC transporter ATP-binding protein, partial [Rhodobacteraceae bacterium]|nr:ABC transporter ATP-binding protein [Paracoccaceae bacterium]